MSKTPDNATAQPMRDSGPFYERQPGDDITRKLELAEAILSALFDQFYDLKERPRLTQDSICALISGAQELVESANRTAKTLPAFIEPDRKAA